MSYLRTTKERRVDRLRSYMAVRYDQGTKRTVIRINRTRGFGCTIAECLRIYKDLFGRE